MKTIFLPRATEEEWAEFYGWDKNDWENFVDENWIGFTMTKYEEICASIYSDGINEWHKMKLDEVLKGKNITDEQMVFVQEFVERKWFLCSIEDVKQKFAKLLFVRWLVFCEKVDESMIKDFSEYVEQFMFHHSKVFGLPIVEDKPLHLKCDYTPDRLQRLYSLCVSLSIIASTTTYNTFAYRMAGVGTPTTQKIEWIMQGKRHKGCSKSGLLRFVEKHGKVRIGQDARSKRIITEVFGLPPISASTISRIDGEHNQLIDHILD